MILEWLGTNGRCHHSAHENKTMVEHESERGIRNKRGS